MDLFFIFSNIIYSCWPHSGRCGYHTCLTARVKLLSFCMEFGSFRLNDISFRLIIYAKMTLSVNSVNGCFCCDGQVNCPGCIPPSPVDHRLTPPPFTSTLQ